MRKFMLAMILCLLPVWASAQGRVIHETFNDSVLTGFTINECRVVTAENRAECNWDGTKDWTDPTKDTEMEFSVPGSGPFMVRVQLRSHEDVDHTAGSKIMRVGFPSGANYFIACQYEQGDSALILGSDGVTFWGTPNAQCGDHGWHTITIYQDSTSFKWWWDGQLLVTRPVNYPLTGAARQVNLMSNWSNNPGWEHDANNHVSWRNIEVYTNQGTGGVGSMSDGTMTQSVGVVPPLPTNCVPGTPQLINSVQDPQCVDGSRQVTEQWTRVGDVPATNGGQACSPIPYSVVTSVPCVVVPPPAQITVITAVKTCRVTIQDVPPDDLGGWGVQFRWNANNFGSKDSSAPFERERDFGAGSYQLGAIWTKTGQTPVYRPTVPYVCQ